MTVEPDVVDRIDHSDAANISVSDEMVVGRDTGDSGTSATARRWIAPGAMAAGLLLGILLAGSFGIGSDIRGGSGALFAQGNLAQKLTSELSGNGAVGPSFWSKEGVFCRVFETRAGAASGYREVRDCRDAATR